MKTMSKKRVSDEDSALFREAMTEASPPATQNKPATKPPQTHLTLSDAFDLKVEATTTLLFSRSGLQPSTLKRLQRGQMTIETRLDLHRHTVSQAQTVLQQFLPQAYEQSQRVLLIIHGKGYGSEQSRPVLKNAVNSWLRHIPFVLAFCSAQAADGGTGAVYVLLRQFQ